MSQKIIYTKTDEAPALATYSFFPIVEAFCSKAGLQLEMKDISLAGRILSQFPQYLDSDQKVPDALLELGELAKTPDANIIKLPNISASIPQLKSAIAELREKGFMVPEFPENPQNEEEKKIKDTYSKVLGSAVNPVLREGNSDRRVASAVKNFAKNNPHSMGKWEASSKTHVAHMEADDFYGSEKSVVSYRDQTVDVYFEDLQGAKELLKSGIKLGRGDVVDASRMKRKSLYQFFKKEIQSAADEDVLFSLHMKATMMKVSDPIIFGTCIEALLEPVYKKYGDKLAEWGISPNLGLGDMLTKLSNGDGQSAEVRKEIEACLEAGPRLAMVDSDKGITNFHVPSDIIIDASMPAMIRNSGKMWGADGKAHDTKAVIPDRCYAGIYQKTIEFCKEHGAFDPSTMGTVANVGLMAKKAEEYGSHDKTFQIREAGRVVVKNDADEVVFEHDVEAGDIWRMCLTRAVAIKDWVSLSLLRSEVSSIPVVFWLDQDRAHDANLIEILHSTLRENKNLPDVEYQILSPVEACSYTLDRVKAGQDTIAATGNVLRDYLTDLFPILELGTSAKMLSIVPLLAGGGLYETGAGGSAPKHVQQLVEENHLRWDSLGEFLALGASLEDLAVKTGNGTVKCLAETLDAANNKFLSENKSPSRKSGEIDNRGSHFYLALYWAEALAAQSKDEGLSGAFSKLASKLKENEAKILDDLISCQGKQVDLGGYYLMDDEKAEKVMRPSATFNEILVN